MASEKQIQANRINAQKAGVKTEEGKAAIRVNAVSHGFFSKEVLLPGEDSQLLDELRDKCIEELEPEGELETMLVERIIACTWQLKRLINSKTKVSSSYVLKHTGEDGSPPVIDYRYDGWQNVMRYETTIDRQLYRAIHELEDVQKARRGKAARVRPSIGVNIPNIDPQLIDSPNEE
jgi:hypothetical protein